MSVPQRAVDVLKQQRGKPICDDCLTGLAGFPRRQMGNLIAATLACTSEYARDRGTCSRCASTNKLVTRVMKA